MGEQRRESFEVNEKPDFTKRWWTIQRGAWIVFAALIGMALLGLTGAGGPLAIATTDAGPALRIEHPRVMRQDADDELRIAVGASREGSVELAFGGDFFSAAEVQSIVPEPQSSKDSPRGVAYVFDVPEGSGGLDVTVHLQASSWGWRQASVSLAGARAAEFDVLVLP